MYGVVSELEKAVGREMDLVVQVGDLGVWPDPENLDVATVNHGGAYDAPDWFAAQIPSPRPTIFIPGNHEDFDFLHGYSWDSVTEILPNLFFLPTGQVTTFESNGVVVRIGGVGGCFGPSDYRKRVLPGRRRRHYTAREIDRCAEQATEAGGLDLLMLHDAPIGTMTGFALPGRKERRFNSQSRGLAELVARTKPGLCLHGHFHGRFLRLVGGVTTIGLNQVDDVGCAIVYEIRPGGQIQPLAEWRALPDWPTETKDPDPIQGELEVPADVDIGPLLVCMQTWREAVLSGGALTRARRRMIYEALPRATRPRKLLMSVLKQNDLEALVCKHLGKGVPLKKLERWFESAPEPASLESDTP